MWLCRKTALETGNENGTLGMQDLLLPGSIGLRLMTWLDGRMMQMTSDKVSTPLGNLVVFEAETHRWCLLRECSRTLTICRNRQLTISLEVALRSDDDYDEPGLGVDLTVAFGFANLCA